MTYFEKFDESIEHEQIRESKYFWKKPYDLTIQFQKSKPFYSDMHMKLN